MSKNGRYGNYLNLKGPSQAYDMALIREQQKEKFLAAKDALVALFIEQSKSEEEGLNEYRQWSKTIPQRVIAESYLAMAKHFEAKIAQLKGEPIG